MADATNRSDAELWKAYRTATYEASITADAPPVRIRIGEPCPSLDALLDRHAATSWIFITAWNPGPARPGRGANRAANSELERELEASGALFFAGVGRGDDPSWEPEESFLALGLDEQRGIELAHRFAQAAILAGERGGAARLVDCRRPTATMAESGAPPFFTRYGFARTGDPAAPLTVEAYPQVCANGALRATVVASAIDLVGGFTAREAAGSDATFTTDLSLRIPNPGVPQMLVARAEPLRVGRRLVTTGVRLEASGATYAYGETTFTRIARREPGATASELATPESIPFHPLTKPLEEEVGLDTLADGSSSVQLTLRPIHLNPEGVLQGALVALLVECAALRLAESTQPGPQVVTELDLRYLATASVGPVVGASEWIGPSEAGLIRVALHDLGRNRLTTTALVRVANAE